MNKNGFLPINRIEMQARGWEQPDFVYITGDAYVDHTSYGPAIISRVLESHGYKVCILPQPNYRDPESVMEFGRPRLGFLVSAGNMDTMVNHYTVAKKKRNFDAYSPGGVIGKRPDRATIVYCGLIRRQYGEIPIIVGGIEASLRRLAHYDYWSDSVKKSILLDSGADLISYGMGERSIVEIADALDSGLPVREITFVAGTVYKTPSADGVYEGIRLPSYQEICESKRTFAESFYVQYQNTDAISGKPLIEQYGARQFVVQNPPAKPLSTEELDAVYALPYMREAHPSYQAQGGIPGFDELKFSLTSCRGCFGGCSFCALTFHQGRTVQVRSHESLLAEAEEMLQEKDFKGYIHDVGGPTANFRKPSCKKQLSKGVCKNRQCLYPRPCPNMEVDHSDYISLLRKLRKLPGVKKVFVRSGIRFDYLMADKDTTFFRELCQHHVSGQLRVAPEHVSDAVLKRMGKPENAVYEGFLKKYKTLNQKTGKEQFVVPYLMSSHPGSTLKEAVELAEYCRDLGYMPEQVQDFYPTPSTLSTCMYYTGLDPRNMEPVYVPKTPQEKAMQRALIQYRDPKNYNLVKEALEKAGRTDLIGFGEKCLIRPRQLSGEKNFAPKQSGHAIAQKDRRNGQGSTTRSKQTSERSGKKKTIRNTHKKK